VAPPALVHRLHCALPMKLAHEMSTHGPSEPDDHLEPPPGGHRPVAAADPLILDEFDPSLSFRDAKERAMTRWERWYVAQLLDYTRGNLSEAARIAHSDRGHLRKLARKHLHWGHRAPHSD
jgi:DNA-binding NtrC family response regulator